MMASTLDTSSCPSSPTTMLDLDLPFAYSPQHQQDSMVPTKDKSVALKIETSKEISKVHATRSSDSDTNENQVNNIVSNYEGNSSSGGVKYYLPSRNLTTIPILRHHHESNDNNDKSPSNGVDQHRNLEFDLHEDYFPKSRSNNGTNRNERIQEHKNTVEEKQMDLVQNLNHSREYLPPYHRIDTKKKENTTSSLSSLNRSTINNLSMANRYRYGPDILSLMMVDHTTTAIHGSTNDITNNNINRAERIHLLGGCEAAQKAANEANECIRNGLIKKAILKHSIAARAYKDVALQVQDFDHALFQSFLLLSQSQAKAGISLHLVLEKDQSNSNNDNDVGGLVSQKHNEVESKKKEIIPKIEFDSSTSPTTTNNINVNDEYEVQNSSSAPDNRTSRNTDDVRNNGKMETNKDNLKKAKRRTSSMAIDDEEKIRAAVRGALPKDGEADITDSTFLGTAGTTVATTATSVTQNVVSLKSSTNVTNNRSRVTEMKNNPIDDMMKLEKELKNMDMAISLGSSVASLSSKSSSKSSSSAARSLSSSYVWDDGSFCVVPPGSSQPSSLGGVPQHLHNQQQKHFNNNNEAGIRARASRIHPSPSQQHRRYEANQQNNNMVHGNIHKHHKQHQQQQQQNLDSSWWDQSSVLSNSTLMSNPNSNLQQTSSTTISSTNSIQDHQNNNNNTSNGVNHNVNTTTETTTYNTTKQVMRLLDSLKVLGDENANLLKQVEDMEEARIEAKAAREEMKKFKTEYAKRFVRLKQALEKLSSKEQQQQQLQAQQSMTNQQNQKASDTVHTR